MYRLRKVKAVNFTAFKSGLKKKIFEIDFSKFMDKHMFIILGGNGAGKSSFVSLIPPTHVPFGMKKTGYILQGQEGLLIREYVHGDGTVLRLKSVFVPTSEGHNVKAFFTIIKDKKEIEMNPEGNIKPYYELVSKYFQVDVTHTDMTAFGLTYYDEFQKNLIAMTRKERIDTINNVITANKRFVDSYEILNDKHRASRNIMKNSMQKLNTYRDETKLKQLLDRTEEYIGNKSKKYEEYLIKITKTEMVIASLLNGNNISEVIKIAEEVGNKIKEIRSEIKKLKHITIDMDIDKLILDTNKSIFELEYEINNSALPRMKEELYSLEEKLEKYELLIEPVEESPEDLYEMLTELDNEVSRMRYVKNIDKYSKMSYSECDLLYGAISQIIDAVSDITSLYGTKSYKFYTDNDSSMSELVASISEISTVLAREQEKLQSLEVELINYESYASLGEKLQLRPPACKIDNCVFIADALEWNKIKPIIEKLKIEIANKKLIIAKYREALEDESSSIDLLKDITILKKNIVNYELFFEKYLDLSLEEMYHDFSKGRLPLAFNYEELRDIMSILSEGIRYNELVNTIKPTLMAKISIINSQNTNSKFIIDEYNLAKVKSEKLIKEIDTKQITHDSLRKNLLSLKEDLSQLELMKEDTDLYNQYTADITKITEEFNNYDSIIREYTSAVENLDSYVEEKNEVDKELKTFYRERDLLKFELLEVQRLKLEISIIENDFIIMDILREIGKPGDGITRDIIDIFMTDIVETANLLLEKTFGGRFKLLPFNEKTFELPYIYNGVEGDDLINASGAQRNIASNCINLSILSKIMASYAMVIYDEPDMTLSPDNREQFIKIIAEYTRMIGIESNFIITHSPEYYEAYSDHCVYILFPDYRINKLKDLDYIIV